MPETPDTPDPTTDTDTDTGHPDPDTAAEPDARPDREAAKYRRQLREAEATAATLASRLEAMQRRDVERLAAEHLTTPGDLWLTGPPLADLLNDEGDVDPNLVSEAVAAVVESRPGWRRPDPSPDYDGGARRPPPRSGPSMQQLLRGGARP